MVFLIQNSQNRDGKALQLKLDELIRSTKGARSQYVGLEDLMDEDLRELDKEFKLLVQRPDVTRALDKLHEKIRIENDRRMTLMKAGGSVMNLFRRVDKSVDKNQKDTTPPTL